MDEKRQEQSEAVSDFYTTKRDTENEAIDLELRVNTLEKELNKAKENKRRNSLMLESAV